MILTFGRYRGRDVREADTGWLGWALLNAMKASPAEREAIREELACRQHGGRTASPPPPPPPPPPSPAGVSLADLERLRNRWYRELALRYHPDRNPGGSDEGMRAINAARELLDELIQELKGRST